MLEINPTGQHDHQEVAEMSLMPKKLRNPYLENQLKQN